MKDQFAVMVEGKSTPSKLHDTLESAQNEAVRLARLERTDVYILEVIGKAEISDVIVQYKK